MAPAEGAGQNTTAYKPTPIGSHVQTMIEIRGPTSIFGSASVVGNQATLTMERSSSVGEKVCPDLRFSRQLTFRKECPVVCLGLDIRRAHRWERDPRMSGNKFTWQQSATEVKTRRVVPWTEIARVDSGGAKIRGFWDGRTGFVNDPDALEPSAEDGQLLMTRDVARLHTEKMGEGPRARRNFFISQGWGRTYPGNRRADAGRH